MGIAGLSGRDRRDPAGAGGRTGHGVKPRRINWRWLQQVGNIKTNFPGVFVWASLQPEPSIPGSQAYQEYSLVPLIWLTHAFHKMEVLL